MLKKAKTKINPKRSDKWTHSYIISTAALAAFGLSTVILTAVYLYIQLWSPFQEFHLERNPTDHVIRVDVKTKVPVEAYLKYGTSQEHLVTAKSTFDESAKSYLKEQTLTTALLLPEKEHFLQVVATTEEGKQFSSRILKIK
ncbi:hypothetical protein GF360_00885 [candidate division WWE3 bacterium]|nr:hypothetical protein [candidate division WWE3 bacterium]